MTQARQRGQEIGADSPSPAAAGLLRVLAASLGARAVVEVGTGSGVSGLALLGGMNTDGILTTIDVDAAHQGAAKAAFAAAGVEPNRARLITGRALEVLPRLADGAYDLVVISSDPTEAASYLEQATRLLRPGGAVVFSGALGRSGAVADPAQRDNATVALRELGKLVRQSEDLVSGLLPVGEGMLVAVVPAS